MLKKHTGILVILFCSWLIATCQAQTSSTLDWLTSEERKFLADHSTIRLAPTPHFPPFEYWDPGSDPNSEDDDIFSGVVSSYLKHLEKELGIKFELVRTKTWAENLKQLEDRDIDAVGAKNLLSTVCVGFYSVRRWTKRQAI